MNAMEWVDEKISSKVFLDQENRKSIRLTDDMFVSTDVFINFFGASIEDETKKDKHVALIGPQTFTWNGEEMTKTGEELGYKGYFDEWKQEGVFD